VVVLVGTGGSGGEIIVVVLVGTGGSGGEIIVVVLVIVVVK